MPPKVSIVLPTYNGERYLKGAVQNCLDQTYQNLELIVVLDGSRDASPAILKSFEDPRLRVIVHKTNQGLPESLNAGFAQTLGDYLTWTSDDNLYEVDAISKLVEYLEKTPAADFVYSGCWLIDESGQIIGERRVSPIQDIREYNCVGACFLYRRSVYQRTGGFNPRERLAEDYEYWVRVSLNSRMDLLPEFLYYYRTHKQSLTLTNYGSYRALRRNLWIQRRYFRLPWLTLAKNMSELYITESFESQKKSEPGNMVRSALLGVFYNPAWLGNRGLLKILLEAFLGKRALDYLLSLKG